MFAFGILFPTGMVLGVCVPFPSVIFTDNSDCQKQVACSSTSFGSCPCSRRILSRSQPQGQGVCTKCARIFLELADADVDRTNCDGSLPAITSGEGDQWTIKEGRQTRTQHPRKGLPGGFVGTDALWRNCCARLLQR